LGATAVLPIVAACQPEVVERVVEKPVVVKETVIVEKPVEVEKIVEKAVEVEKEVIVEKEVEVVVEKEVVVVATAMMEPKPTLRFSHWWGDTFQQKATILPLYKEMFGVQIDDEPTGWSQYSDKLLTQLAGGVGPDIVMSNVNFNGFFFPRLLNAQLDETLKAHNVDMAKFTADPRRENGYRGKIFGLNIFYRNPLIINVNTKLADEVGVKLPEWGSDYSKSDPEFDTWSRDTFVEWLKAGTKRTSDGRVEQYGIGSTFSNFSTDFNYWAIDNGGQMFPNPWGYEDDECLVNSPEFVQTATEYTDMVLKHKVAPTIDAANAVEGGMYRAGKAMAVIAWAGGHNYSGQSFEQTAIHHPWNNVRSSSFGADYWTANNSSQHRDEAVDFVVRAPTNFDIAHALTFVASVPSYEPRKHMDILTYEDQENPQRFLVQAEIWASRCLSPGVSHSPQSQEKVEVFPDWRGKAPLFYNSAMRTAAQSILIGESTPKEALDVAKADIDAELKKVRF
jgi:ABC-type glycerol-3-phosphate transport system substrate-binding protein